MGSLVDHTFKSVFWDAQLFHPSELLSVQKKSAFEVHIVFEN